MRKKMNTRKINQIEMHPTNAMLKDANYTIEQEEDIYNKQLQHIIDSPGLYLESLDFLRTYKVRWKDYKHSNTPTMPYKYTRKGAERESL